MSEFDYDLIIIGAGVGGHGAALHAVKSGLKTAIVEAEDMGGTCVNRGCIPSKALLAASGRVREFADTHHLQDMGIQLGGIQFDRSAIADHATNLVNKIQGDLTNSLKRLKVDIIRGWGELAGTQKLRSRLAKGIKSIPLKILCSVLGLCLLYPEVLRLTAKQFLLVTRRLG